MSKLKVISLFAGPGAGKSTTAAALFAKMKRLRFDVELVTEYAKDLTYEKSFDKLSNQLLVFAEQNYRQARLEGHTEFVITDSPLPLSLVYAKGEDLDWFDTLVRRQWDKYHNYPIMLKRTSAPYVMHGRTQTLEQAKELDEKIWEVAREFKTEHIVDPDHPDAVDYIIRLLNWDKRAIA